MKRLRVLIVSLVVLAVTGQPQTPYRNYGNCDSAEDAGQLGAVRAYRFQMFEVLPSGSNKEIKLKFSREVELLGEDNAVTEKFYNELDQLQQTIKYVYGKLGSFSQAITYNENGQEISRKPISSELWVGALLYETKNPTTARSEYSESPDCSRIIRTDYDASGKEVGSEVRIVKRILSEALLHE